jgi:hypothetical protein
MELLLLIWTALVTLGAVLALRWVRRRIEASESALIELIPEPVKPEDYRAELADYLASIDTKMEGLERTTRNLQLDLEEGIQRVDRAERRTRAVVTKARRELRDAGFEHPGIEAEVADLHLLDGGIGPEEGLPAVREDVAMGPPDVSPSAVPGLTVNQLGLLMNEAV